MCGGILKATGGGGQLHELGRGWAKSFMQGIGFVVRKTTKTAKKLPQIRRKVTIYLRWPRRRTAFQLI